MKKEEIDARRRELKEKFGDGMVHVCFLLNHLAAGQSVLLRPETTERRKRAVLACAEEQINELAEVVGELLDWNTDKLFACASEIRGLMNEWARELTEEETELAWAIVETASRGGETLQ